MPGPEIDRAVAYRLRRGMLELDLILERFHRDAYPSLDAAGRRSFSRLLEAEDDQLWTWLTGRAEPDEPELADAVRCVRRHAGL